MGEVRPMTQEAKEIAARLDREDIAVMLDLVDAPHWLMGSQGTFKDYASRNKFYEMGLLTAVFPESVKGDSGRQFWTFNDLGRVVASLLREGK